MALFLTETDIEPLVNMPDMIARVDEITRAQAVGEAYLVPRERLRMGGGGMLHTMSAAWPQRGYFAHKAYASVKGEVRFRVFLYDQTSGEILAVCEGNRLGQLRTGAATAVAAKPLWPAQDDAWALVGTGLQAWGQLEALAEINRPECIYIYSRNKEHRQRFAARAEATLQVSCRPVESAEAAVEAANVVITATTSREPVFDGHSLQTGSFVAAVGANMLIRRELDGKALRKCDHIVVDDRETAKRESGMLLTPMEAGFLHWPEILELPQLIGAGQQRQSADQTWCFHSLGSATWDLASAILAYERAREAGAGQELPLT